MKYTVKAPLDHDLTRYQPGGSVELSEEQAAPLLTAGVIEAAPEPAGKPGKK